MVGLTIRAPPFLVLRDEEEEEAEREVLNPLRPPRLPPRPNLLRPIVWVLVLVLAVGVGEVSLSRADQAWGFCWPFSGSGEEVLLCGGAGRLAVAMTLRANQPPRSRERKIGRRAGAEAVMRARLVSMAEVTKPTLLEAALGKMETMKSPWRRITRRMMEVIVTLWGVE